MPNEVQDAAVSAEIAANEFCPSCLGKLPNGCTCVCDNANPFKATHCVLPKSHTGPHNDMLPGQAGLQAKGLAVRPCTEEEIAAAKARLDDPINPSHYNQGSIDCIDAIEAALTPDEFRGFLKGQIMKYCWRERSKNGLEDLDKANWYARRLVEFLRKQNASS